MKKSLRWMMAAAAIPVAFAVSCRTAAGRSMDEAVVAPPPPAPVVAPAPADTGHHGEADAAFMRGMIGHHAQALEMTALVPGRFSRPEIPVLAERITTSQHDEIALMQRWLSARGLEAPAVDSAHAHGEHADHGLMPGMLTREEMARLAASTGADFDRLFLESMIRHHEGALVMVAQLFATRGAAQEAETYQFAADVDADQRAEIVRMRRLLATPPR